VKGEKLTDIDEFLAKAKALGATGAKSISHHTVITAPWVRLKCQFGCGGYNTSLCCPPNTPTPQQMREVLDGYTRAILVHCKGKAKPGKIVAKLEKEIFLSGFYKALALGAGPCRLCKECNKDECIHAEDARPSMEACGIDVYATVRSNGFPIEVVKDRTCEQNYYGIVLVD
jgi:predicted metal-binding protein